MGLVIPAGPCRSQVSDLGSEQPGSQHSVSRKCRRPGVHPEADWEHTACSGGLAPQSLGSNPEASGRSPQISLLPDPDQSGQQHHISRSYKREEGLWAASGVKSVCSGESSRPLQEPPGVCFRIGTAWATAPCLQAVQEVSCAPEATWEGAACTGESSIDKTN